MERFFGTLKSEFFHLDEFDNLRHLRAGIKDYIRYYNEERSRTKLGTSPVTFRMRATAV